MVLGSWSCRVSTTTVFTCLQTDRTKSRGRGRAIWPFDLVLFFGQDLCD